MLLLLCVIAVLPPHRYGVSGRLQTAKIGMLSEGQKSRLIFAMMCMKVSDEWEGLLAGMGLEVGQQGDGRSPACCELDEKLWGDVCLPDYQEVVGLNPTVMSPLLPLPLLLH